MPEESRRKRRSILLFATLWLLGVGIVVSVAALAPLVGYIPDNQEKRLVFVREAQASAIEQYLQRAEDTASQITSRTRIRDRLHDYNEKNISLELLVDYTKPKLSDAMNHSDEVVGIVRLDSRGRPVVGVGRSLPSSVWQDREPEDLHRMSQALVDVGNEQFLVVTAPIVNRRGKYVGADVVMFDLDKVPLLVHGASAVQDDTYIALAIRSGTNLTVLARGDRLDLEHETVGPDLAALRQGVMRAFRGERGVMYPGLPSPHHYVIAYQPLHDQQWALVLSRSRDVFLAPLKTALITMVVPIAGLILLGAIGMWLALRPLTGSLIMNADELRREIERTTARLEQELEQRIRLEEDLRHKEERFRSIFDFAAQAIALVDRDTRLVEVNSAWCEMFGYTKQEALELTNADLCPAEELDNSQQRLHALFREESGPYRIERPYVRKDGTVFRGLVSVSAIRDAQHRVINAVTVVDDITYRKQVERELRERAGQLERSNQELEAFAHVASHDLQEPLRSVEGFLRLLHKRCGDQLGEEGKEYLDFALNASQRMRRLIRDLLTYSRLGRAAELPEWVETDEVVQRVVLSLRTRIEETRAKVQIDPLPPVRGERSQVQMLFQNLLANALKFRGQETPVIHIYAEQDNAMVRFTVTDNGIGIDAQYFEAVFQVFRRLHSRAEYPGTGIGLAVCQKIVERAGGKIWVESEPGQGTSFLFTLPPAESR